MITDLNMPVKDGLAMIRLVRTRPQCKFTPILVLTGESKLELKAQGQAAGANGWIVKPFTPDQLLHVIAKLLPEGTTGNDEETVCHML